MATLKVHEEDCIQYLGEPFTHVHEYLDQLFKYLGPGHRGFRHNWKGVEEVHKRWGDRAASAAYIHIERDRQGDEIKDVDLDQMATKVHKYFDKMRFLRLSKMKGS